MTIVLTYTKLDGSKHKAGIDENISKISFNYDNMASIDLSGIGECINLQNLELQGNNLQTIDLATLGSCKSLKTLELGGNNLQSIDLDPLKSCNNLQELWVVGHKLQTINLSPLRHCTNLQTFGLGGSMLQNIDLTPLGSCINLSELRIGLTELQSINVFPLSSCINLRKFRFGWNKLRSIDLSPLSSCTSLQTINLSKNELQSIDLDPLRLTTKLQMIDLSDNHLKRIELSAFSSCAYLEDISLKENKLKSINLNPLWSCKNLKTLDLTKNELRSVDFTPIYFTRGVSIDDACKGYSWLIASREGIVYERPSDIYPWPFLHHIAKMFGKDPRVQQDILHAMGLKNYGFIDCDLEDLFLSIPPQITIEEAVKQVANGLIREIAKSVDRGGTTTGLRLEELITKHVEIAIRAQEITEIRDSEIKRVRVGESSNEVDLKELWLTAYGYDVLTALGKKLITSVSDFEQVKHTFSDMGFELQGNKTSIPGAKMGNILKMVVLWIIKNRNEQWYKISPVNLSRWWEELFEQQLNEFDFLERKREFDREIDEERRRKFYDFEEDESQINQTTEEDEVDEVDVLDELNPEEERLFIKGKKMKRREREKEKKMKSGRGVQWRRS